MKQITALSILAAALAATPALAQQLASASPYVDLRAGPGRDYPLVASLPSGIDITVVGCVGDYRWCDIVSGPYRGWVYAGNIIYPYQSGYVPLLTYGPPIGIGIIGFDLGYYWDHHYRGRPWYGQRRYWVDRPHGDVGRADHHAGPRFDGGARQHRGQPQRSAAQVPLQGQGQHMGPWPPLGQQARQDRVPGAQRQWHAQHPHAGERQAPAHNAGQGESLRPSHQ